MVLDRSDLSLKGAASRVSLYDRHRAAAALANLS